jgi:hypothetical protein
MQAVRVVGRFLDQHKNPVKGRVKFTPSQIWVEEGADTFPTLAPDVELNEGVFDVMVTRTDSGNSIPWHYTVECPAGRWTVYFSGDGPFQLAQQLKSKRT